MSSSESSRGDSSQGSNNVMGNGPFLEPWEFKLFLTRDEVLSQYIHIPESVLDTTSFYTHIDVADLFRLHEDQMVRVSLWSFDRSEFYDMNLKVPHWDPRSLVLVPWRDRISGEFEGAKFFQDFPADSGKGKVRVLLERRDSVLPNFELGMNLYFLVLLIVKSHIKDLLRSENGF